MLKVLDNPALNTFQFHFGELTKLYLEAKDNVKFLTTLERHFKYIADGSFVTITESMYAMLNGLKMVWVISRHYNTDERMSPLMESIARTLARRVREEVRLDDVLSMSFGSARQLVQQAKDVLECWNSEYFVMRKKIEDSGSDHRWEFDRKLLFGETDYMSEICSNLLEVVDALDHFHKFLGPELKAVTGDSAGIDEVLKRVSRSINIRLIPYQYHTNIIPIPYQYHTNTIPIPYQYHYHTNKIPIPYPYHSNTIPILYRYHYISSRLLHRTVYYVLYFTTLHYTTLGGGSDCPIARAV